MRNFLKTAAFFAAVTLAAPGIAQETPKQGGTLTIAFSQVPRHFNPAVQSGNATMIPGAQIFATLMRADENWNIKPYLAESWETAPDGLSVTFKLHPDAKFHDGKPITSQDVAFSIETQKAHHPFKTALAAVSAVETPDARTAVIRLSEPHPALMIALSTTIAPIIPKHIYGDGQDAKKHPQNIENVIGSGAFVLKEYKNGEHIVLERNPDYFLKGRPYLDKVVYRINRDGLNRTIMMQNGEAQMYPLLNAIPEIRRMQDDENLTVTDTGYSGQGSIAWLAFNTKSGPLSDLRVRQAIAYAIDRNFIVNALLQGQATPATGPIAQGSPFYTDNVETYDLDLEKAAKLLDEAGLAPDANGVRAELTIDHIPAVPQVQLNVAEYIRAQLKKVGLKVAVRSAPDFPSWAKRISGWDFDMTMDIVANWGDPVIGVHRTYRCDNITKGVIWSNTQQYCNEKLDSLMLSAGKETDIGKRKELYKEIQQIVAHDLPVYPIVLMPQHTAFSKTVGNAPTSIWGPISPLDDVYLK